MKGVVLGRDEIKRSYQNFPFRFAYLYRKVTQFYTKKIILDVQEALKNLEKYKLKLKGQKISLKY